MKQLLHLKLVKMYISEYYKSILRRNELFRTIIVTIKIK